MTPTVPPSLPAHQLLHARIATKAHFFICGLLFATWGVHVPTVKAQFGLSEAQLAWLMLAAGIGSLITLTRVGGWVARHGARPVVLCGARWCCAAPAWSAPALRPCYSHPAMCCSCSCCSPSG
ncbi:hypothetical protein [Uliginosibacterium sp. TH139]|uniref:hypothetical protein n=1 Tax=Uliginosibacterium sp. TH139 TaxID=2067453 RepID=UPI001C1FF537|nr:hypothetical protein [Uliginosibacterium sp. TH139]